MYKLCSDSFSSALSSQPWMFVRSGATRPLCSPSTWGRLWGGWRAGNRSPTQSTRISSSTELFLRQTFMDSSSFFLRRDVANPSRKPWLPTSVEAGKDFNSQTNANHRFNVYWCLSVVFKSFLIFLFTILFFSILFLSSMHLLCYYRWFCNHLTDVSHCL